MGRRRTGEAATSYNLLSYRGLSFLPSRVPLVFRRHFIALASSIAASCTARLSFGAENDAAAAPSAGNNPNLQTATMGGLQYWADELIFHKYHIQRNTLSGHYRLLDDGDERLAWGTFDECRAKLDEIKR